MTPETISTTDAPLTRRQLAARQADELSRALFPNAGKSDDHISENEKSSIASAVAAIKQRHNEELNAWISAQRELSTKS